MHTNGPWKALCESQKKLLHTFRVKLDFLEQERIPRLESINAELLEALEYLIEEYPNNRGMNKAREAISKAKES